jgi:NIMA (never in mitosis gene a)-related kinase
VFIWRTALQLLHGIKALHKLMVFHRDIKPANILLTKNGQCAKLADMNVSVISKNGMAVTQTGTPFYSSPEVWMENPYTGKSDIWSLGCVLYEMASLRPPFTAGEMHGLKRKILEVEPEPIPCMYSRELQSLIKICLEKEQKYRLSAQQILNIPFIREKQKKFVD